MTLRRGGNAAHLDLGGERGEAIVRGDARPARADRDERRAVRPGGVGRVLTAADDPGRRHAGVREVYSTSHARATAGIAWSERSSTASWRTTPMGSVRRLVTYEDYALRSLRDAGVGVARTYGVVELTPNREYMLVTEFFEGGRNLSDSDVDDTVIDRPQLVRRLWDAGVRHRDLKPANLLVSRAPAARGCLGPGSASVAVAPGRRPGEHDALPRAAHRRGSGVRASDVGLHARGDRRRVRQLGGARDPDGARGEAEGRRSSTDRSVQGAGARARAGLVQRWSPRRAALTAAVGTGVLVLAAMLLDSVRAGLT